MKCPIAHLLLILLLGNAAVIAHGKEIETNAMVMTEAPAWLSRGRVDRVTEHMQTQLEWTIRKIQVHWYTSAARYQEAHHLGPLAIAVTVKAANTIHLGPEVKEANFDSVFGHELVHIILGQKYKDAIPAWLEEGLANHLAKRGQVDYAWLAKQPPVADVRRLSHPFSGTINSLRYHYAASQALAELIAAKCDMTNLLRLSVEKGIDPYLDTYCEIPDLNAAFKAWVAKKAQVAAKP